MSQDPQVENCYSGHTRVLDTKTQNLKSALNGVVGSHLCVCNSCEAYWLYVFGNITSVSQRKKLKIFRLRCKHEIFRYF